MSPTDKLIADHILDLLRRRGPGKTICPSEVARALFPDRWRDEMPRIRDVARGLARAGAIVVTQAGQEVDLDDARGAIRLRLR
jgi:hypothetical protein